MRRFTPEEIVIAGKPQIVEICLAAMWNAVTSTRPISTRVLSRQANRKMAATHLLLAYEKLQALGVDVMREPAPRGPNHERRRKNAARATAQVLELIDSLAARD